MAKIIDKEGTVIHEGNYSDMEIAHAFLTKPSWVLAETRGLKMADLYKLRAKYWTDKARNAVEPLQLLTTK